jgi:hypothetical protein
MARFLTDAGARVVPIDLDVVAGDTRDRFVAYERTLGSPSNELRARLDADDPDRAGFVYAGSFASAGTVCGRRVIGARHPRHLEAERKDRQRELLHLGGQIVDLVDGLTHLRPPVVVQGIPDHGVAMATSHTYLVPRPADGHRLRELATTLMRDCTRAVVASFNPGTPCTFYGFVTATAVVDFGPVEALVYWDPLTWRIHAPGILRPLPLADGVVASARSAVHAVARQVHHQLGYIGAFGTDGILDGDRYTIHEVNPRVCAGFSLLDQLVPDEEPLAAVDLGLREFPEESARLASPLVALSAVVQRDPTPAYRLWESTSQSLRPTDQFGPSTWSAQVRKAAAEGRRPIASMEEASHENDLS